MKYNIKNVIEEFTIQLPLFGYYLSIYSSIITNNYHILYFTILYFLGNMSNNLIKNFLKKSGILPENIGNRPSGCGNRKIGDLCRGCGYWTVYKDDIGSNSYGFPSGHAQSMAILAIFWSLYIWKKNSIKTFKQYVLIGLLFLLAVVVCYQRVNSKCHTVLQVISGTIIGILFGILSYYICNKLAPNTFPK